MFGILGKKRKEKKQKRRDKNEKTIDHDEDEKKKKDNNSKKTQLSHGRETTKKNTSAALTAADCKILVHDFVEHTLKKGVEGLRAEFASHKRVLDMSKMTVFSKNAAKNRYKDVGCIDETRVVLKENDGNDYIHANYVSTPSSEKRFICCQAPLDSTCVDHWRMIVQERVEVILMLCNLTEKGAKKCAEYFPTEKDQTKTFGKYTIRVIKTQKMEIPYQTTTNIRHTVLMVEVDGKAIHTVDHYHWMDWPDRGVPPADLASIFLLQRIAGTQFVLIFWRLIGFCFGSPIVVHCSAGIGRTGSIVLIQYTLELINARQTCENMDVLLLKLRKQRANSVQTDHQYLYVHQVLLNYFQKEGFLDKSVLPFLESFTAQYKAVITGG